MSTNPYSQTLKSTEMPFQIQAVIAAKDRTESTVMPMDLQWNVQHACVSVMVMFQRFPWGKSHI